MTDKKEVVETKETTVEKAEAARIVPAKPQSPLWWVLGTLIAVVFIILLAGAFKQAFYLGGNDGRYDNHMGFNTVRGDRGGMRGGMMHDDNDDSHVTGVVTAIDNATLTVAGEGTTKKVTINDSTEYYGAAQPVKVNDTVRIMGTTSDDSFTASKVMISRE
jgi:hypothetical protein